MAPIRYSLHYEDYSEHLMSRFGKLLQTQSLVDMTLMCSSHTLRVHKAVLAASSAYFQEVLQKQTGEPLIILKMRFGVLKCLVEFMYCGKTQCLEENLDELVSAAQFLKIKGLSKVTKEGLGIECHGELPVFTPPVVINRPPQSLIDLHSQDPEDPQSSTPLLLASNSSQSAIDNLNRPNKDMVVRIPFDIDGGSVNGVDYSDPSRPIKPRRGRPSYRRSAGWDAGGAFGRATERALLHREQDSRKAIHQLKHMQTRHMQDYMDRVTLSQAVSSICDSEPSSHNYMNIDNDLIYMDQTVSSNVLDSTIPYPKEHALGNETITSNYPSTVTSAANDNSNGGIGNAMSQYVNALKSAGLPTDLPILFESGDGSYINVNEQVLLDMVQSSEIQYEVIEQPNIMEKVSDPSEIKSIDDLSKSIERGEILMGSKKYSAGNSYNKHSSAHDDAINSLNEILPDNLDSFAEQQNYVVMGHDLQDNSNPIDQDGTNDFSCIESDMQFFTKSMSDDVKKYYEERLSETREIEQLCPASTSLDTSFSMSLLDTKITHLSDPITQQYSGLNKEDLRRNDECYDFTSQLPNPNEFKDETLDYLISTPKRNGNDITYDEETLAKRTQERDEIIKDLMNIESNISMENNKNVDKIQLEPKQNSDFEENTLQSSTTEEKLVNRDNIESNFATPSSNDLKWSVNKKETNEPNTEEDKDSQVSILSNTPLDPASLPDPEKNPDKWQFLDSADIDKENLDTNTDSDLNSTLDENIPFAVGLLPLKQVQVADDETPKRKMSFDEELLNNVDSKYLKRKVKYKKV